MCLSCKHDIGAHGKKQIKELWNHAAFRAKVYLHTPNNKEVHLNKKQITEIENNALVVIATGVDFCTDVWAIQWPNDYKVKTI